MPQPFPFGQYGSNIDPATGRPKSLLGAVTGGLTGFLTGGPAGALIGAVGGALTPSGGNQTQQTTNQTFSPPSYTTDGSLGPGTTWQEFLARGGQIANNYATNPHIIYGNDGQPMVAQMSQLQNQAANGYNAQASAVPWQEQQQTNLNANDLLNGYMYNGGVNPYAGDNPYLQQMLNSSNNDITQQFQNGTAAQTDAAAARAHAYGGTGYQEQQALNAKGLGQVLAQNEANVRGQNYYNSANLAENALGRGMQALGLNNQTNYGQLAALQGLMGAGNLQQQTQQNNINAAQNLFNANVQMPMTMEDYYGNILQQASGQGRSSTSTTTVPGASPLTNGIGAGLAAGSLFGNGGGPNLSSIGNFLWNSGLFGSGGAAP